MELRHLRYFLAVVEHRHFGRAAERLGIRQPPLSQQIQALERELDVRLLDRTSRQVELTEAGRAFLEPARRAVAAAEEAAQQARRAARGQAGRLAVGFVGSTERYLPSRLRGFSERYPNVELELRELPTAAQVEGLVDGTLDVGFLRPPLPVGEGVLETVDVVRESLVAALPNGHRLAGLRAVPVARLAGEPFVLFPRPAGPGLYDRIVRLCQDAGFEPRVVQHATEMRTLLGLVTGGFGISIVPSSVRGDGVSFRPLDPAAPITLAMAWRADNARPIVQNFRRVVQHTTAPHVDREAE